MAKTSTISRRLIRRVRGWIDAGAAGGGADRRRHLHRLRHPRFSRPAGRLDEEPRGREAGDDPALRGRSRGPQAGLAQPARVAGSWEAQPNAGHRALVALERRGKLDTLITQNVDGLHQAAGSSPERVVEVHGTTREVVCLACGERAAMERALARVRAGEEDPPCRTCGGILKSATISFGQCARPRGSPARGARVARAAI